MNKKGHRSFGYIRTLPSGRFQASYVGPDKKRYFAPSSYKAARDANAWLAKRQVEISQESWEPPRKPSTQTGFGAIGEATLDSVLEEFLSQKLTKGAKPLLDNTKDLYRRLSVSALAEFQHVPLSAITKEQVDEWYLRRVSSGKITTASKGYKLLKMVFNWAIKKKLALSNPCDIEGAQSATTGKIVDSPEPEEVRAISNFMPDEWKFAVMLGAYAGLRYGELTELRRKDIIFYRENGEEHFKVSVGRAVSYFNKSFRLGAPKTKLGVRVIEVNKALIPELREHVENHVKPGKDSLLFSNSDGYWIRHDYFMRAWAKSLTLSGLEGRSLTPHGLRHFGATQLVLAGATLPELKIWLGDSSTEAVSRYLHATGRNRGLANNMKFA